MGITQSDTVLSVMKASDRLGTHQADKENGNILSPISKRNKRHSNIVNLWGIQVLTKTHCQKS